MYRYRLEKHSQLLMRYYRGLCTNIAPEAHARRRTCHLRRHPLHNQATATIMMFHQAAQEDNVQLRSFRDHQHRMVGRNYRIRPFRQISLRRNRMSYQVVVILRSSPVDRDQCLPTAVPYYVVRGQQMLTSNAL